MSQPPVPMVGIGVFVFNDDNEFLMGRRKGSVGSGTWSLAGGHLEFGETFEECAAREVLEETDLEIIDIRFWTAVNNVMADVGKHYITIFMLAKVDTASGSVAVRNMEPEKCDGWEWVRWEDMKSWGSIAKTGPDEIDGVVATEENRGGRRELFSPLLNLLHQRPNLSPVGA